MCYKDCPDGSYQHEYVLRDHLGNTRVTFSDANNDGLVGSTDIKQINAYYPFGLNMESNFNGAAGKNKYAYNGKEWNDDFGLGWNDYGARFYDPAVDRWWNIDPESESGVQSSWNPYHYVFDNPIKNTDPDGREAEECCGGLTQALAQVTGGAIGFTDNLLGTNLRESVGNHLYGRESSLRTSFDNGVTQADQASLVAGTGLIAGGGIAVEGGATVSLSGVGATAGVPTMVAGGVAIVTGTVITANAAKNLQNSQVKANQNGDGSFGGGKDTNSKTGNEAFRQAKEQNGIPRSQQPTKTTTVSEKGTGKPLKQYTFKNSKGETVNIRKDNPKKYGSPGGEGDQGKHFNAGKVNSGKTKLEQHHNYEN